MVRNEILRIMTRTLSALITFFAILLLVTPLVNLVMIPEGPSGFLISAALLFWIWIVLIFKTYLFSRNEGSTALSSSTTIAEDDAK